MMSGKYGHMDDVSLLEIVKEAMERQLQITTSPDVWTIKRAYHAIPQYPVGYADQMACFKNHVAASHPSFCFLGTAFNGVSINDCIASSEFLSHLPKT
jgi:oxygen-dependent protoporphyrinogen oxidase